MELGVVPQLDTLFVVFSFAALIGSALILVGWELNESVLKGGGAGLRATQPLGAALLLGAALATLLGSSTSKSARGASRTIGAAIIGIAAFIILQNTLDVDWGSDRLLFPLKVVTDQTGPFLRPGRPAGCALLGLIALGWCLVTRRSQHPIAIKSYFVATQLGLIGATISLLAYGLDIAPLYVMGLYAQASLPGSLMLWLLFVCAVIARRDLDPFSRLFGESIGAISARSMISWTVCLLLVLITTVQFSSNAHWYRSELIVLFVTVTGLMITSFGLLAHMRRLDQIDERQRELKDTAKTLHRRAVSAGEARVAAEKDKRQLVANLAHELRNPLAAISYSRDLLALQGPDSPHRDQLLQAMARQIDKLKAIVDSGLAKYDETKPSTQISTEPR